MEEETHWGISVLSRESRVLFTQDYFLAEACTLFIPLTVFIGYLRLPHNLDLRLNYYNLIFILHVCFIYQVL